MPEPIIHEQSWWDPTMDRVYDWERVYVDARVAPAILSRDECHDFIRMVSLHLGVRIPELSFVQGGNCFATMAGTMTLADWGRTHQTLLHEMAHIATLDYILAGEAPHGERFVFQAIDLYVTFLGLDLATLTNSALEMKIIDRAHPIMPAKWEEPAFFAGEF